MREETVTLLDSLTEADLDTSSAKTPDGFQERFGTYRRCLQFVAGGTVPSGITFSNAVRAQMP